MYLAIDLFLNREQYKEFSKDPLQSQEIDRTGGE
jgi:4-hydroxythreonine-4-phosphate dehydrogenase